MLELELPSEKKYQCVCGRKYDHRQSLYTHRKVCPAAPAEGEDDAVVHLREEIEGLRRKVEALSGGGAAAQVVNDDNRHVTINAPVFQQEVHINYWGEEDLSFLDKRKVQELLDEAIERGPDIPSSAEWLYREVMRQAIADPQRPQNLTAYIPNKSSRDPIVHMARGWSREPSSETIFVPVVSRVLDRIFINQPFVEEHKKYAYLLGYLRDQEPSLARSQVMRTLLENNKGSLKVVMGSPPLPGAPPTRQILAGLPGAPPTRQILAGLPGAPPTRQILAGLPGAPPTRQLLAA